MSRRVEREELKFGAMLSVMRYLLEYQAANYDDLGGEEQVFLWLAQILNDELRMRSPHRNRTLHRELWAYLDEVKLPRRRSPQDKAPAEGAKEK